MVETYMFNPNEHTKQCEEYLSSFLHTSVCLLQAEPLARSTRQAPWRLDVEINGTLRRYVLRLDSGASEHEFATLRAMEAVSIPTPRAYGWDPNGKALGVRCYFSDFIEGESLLQPMLAGERWAEDLYISTVCALQEVTHQQLSAAGDWLGEAETAYGVFSAAQAHFKEHPLTLTTAVSEVLSQTMPEFPTGRFSNGDLWLDNLIIRDRELAGVIDFEQAGFSDPIYEFLLPFFVAPSLRSRGIEERYCARMGFNPGVLRWYRGLEYFELWHWMQATGRQFEHYTFENLQRALQDWLDEI